MNDDLSPSSPLRPPATSANADGGSSGLSRAPFKAPSALRIFAASALPRIVGYGLLVLFFFDLIEILIGYKPFNPQADALLVAQIVERIAVPLLAYAFIFLSEDGRLGKGELLIRKFISFSSLFWLVICLALLGLAVSSSLRLSRTAASNFQRQTLERSAFFDRFRAELPRFTDVQVLTSYNELVRKPQGLGSNKVPSTEEMRAAVIAALPAAVETELGLVNESRRTARLQIYITGAKYSLGALISAIVFLFIWEATYASRRVRVFRRRSSPNLGVEDRFVSWFEQFSLWASEFSPLPNFEDYRWFRRLKRSWRHWRESRRH